MQTHESSYSLSNEAREHVLSRSIKVTAFIAVLLVSVAAVDASACRRCEPIQGRQSRPQAGDRGL